MLKIAITGGVGSGKSTVARMFRELGVPVIDADEVARAVVAPGQPAWHELRKAFGPEIFQEDGQLDRHRLSQWVFLDPEARRRLEAIVHPRVAAEIRSRLAQLEGQGTPLVLVEVPLLFEAGLEKYYDRVIVVDAGEADQVRRLRDRDRRSEAEIAGILAAQLPLPEKVKKADFVVDNRGDLNLTLSQVKIILRELQKSVDSSSQKG
jgi:dephospho-CoA kinase